ncbi:MAG: hypothetical protein IKT79_03065, partial [Akkermansia sp.]|nr:hypothetical protein [Akkermansia sp.]
LPENVGTVCLQDAESGRAFHVNMNSTAVRKAYHKAMKAHRSEWDTLFAQLGITMKDLQTNTDFIPALRALFTQRSSHFAR